MKPSYYPVFSEMLNEAWHLPHETKPSVALRCDDNGIFFASVSWINPDGKHRMLEERFDYQQINSREMTATNLLRGVCNRAKGEIFATSPVKPTIIK